MNTAPTLPFEVPPWNDGGRANAICFYWWSWHPLYPYWSKSCWQFFSEEDAWRFLGEDRGSSLSYYHNKLVRQGDGHYTIVGDQPPLRPEVWWKIYQDIKSGKVPPEPGLVVPNIEIPAEYL